MVTNLPLLSNVLALNKYIIKETQKTNRTKEYKKYNY